jgi:hypothetical protein
LQKGRRSSKVEFIPIFMSSFTYEPGKPIQVASFRSRHHFMVRALVLAVCLSYRDLEEIMWERGLQVDHTTIYRWVQRYAPELEKRCRPHLKATTDSRTRG